MRNIRLTMSGMAAVMALGGSLLQQQTGEIVGRIPSRRSHGAYKQKFSTRKQADRSKKQYLIKGCRP